ncbi:MAG: hypothetical protein WAM24_22910 [Ignavibacteriaceae bacterium]
MSSNKNYSEDAKNFFFNENNKKKKKELEEKYGMLSMSDEENLPPEIMNQFLSNVIEFEKKWKNAESKRIIEILGFPEFKKIEELKLSDFKTEIADVLAKYADHNINIDVLEKDELTEQEFYKFLTEELPGHETDFMSIPGMTTNYIYEEFHPNNKLDAKDTIEWFSFPFMKKDKKEMRTFLSENSLSFNGSKKSKTEFIKEMLSRIDEFGKDAENKIKYKKFEFDNSANTGKVNVQFTVSNKKDKRINYRKKILNLIFELEKSDYGGFNIKGCSVKE